MTSANSNDNNVGILAMEVYTPRTFVQQSALEEHNGIPAGKYTIGLGQQGIGITGDAEDVNSLCLTVVHRLLENHQIDPNSVGRLEIGTETLVDKSKSTKTVLMQLFPNNTDLQGATVVNACYGGTSAFLNAIYWCDSNFWDGRYAIVVAADIAVYDQGPARPTSGAGAVAFLIGRDAPLAIQPGSIATHAAHVWDFFKPNPSVEYPTVDGKHSQTCYYQALEDCYEQFCEKQRQINDTNGSSSFGPSTPDYWVFHAPYNKLVQKSYARLFLLDFRSRYRTNRQAMGDLSVLKEEWLSKPLEETYNDKSLEKVLNQLSATDYQQRLMDANAASIRVGNTYAASVFLGLASLVDRRAKDLKDGTSIVVFSYGSGSMATMYQLKVRTPSNSSFSCVDMAAKMNLTGRLDAREEVHPSELDMALDTRAKMHKAGAPYTPIYPTLGRLFPGTYYLMEIDAQWRRQYSRVPVDAPVLNANPNESGNKYVDLAPSLDSNGSSNKRPLDN